MNSNIAATKKPKMIATKSVATPTNGSAEIATRPSRINKRRTATHPIPNNKASNSQQPVEDAERMFLTPRVIDGGAYDEMSTNLRSLIEQASGLTSQLASVVERAENTHAELKTSAKRYDDRLNLGARLFESVCKRADTVDAIAQEIGERVEYMKQFETTVNAKHYTFCTGLQAEVEQALENLRLSRRSMEDEVDDHSDKFNQQIAKWEEVAEHLNTRLDRLPEEIRSSSQPTIDEIDNLIQNVRSLTEINEDADAASDDRTNLHHLLKQVEDTRLQAVATLSEVDKSADRCAAVRELMGQEVMSAVDTMDRLSSESESLQTTIDAAAELANALAGQTDVGEQRLQEHCNTHIRTIDHQIQEQTGRLKSMKSEVVGITIEFDQRKEEIADLLNEHADEINAANQTVEYLKRWEIYLADIDADRAEDHIPPALTAVLERTRAIVDGELTRIRDRFADIAKTFDQLEVTSAPES